MSHHQNSLGPDALAVSAPVTPPPPPRCHSDEEEEDLNKALGVQCFQQILLPAARSPPEKHRVYNEQDFEDHRHSSLHVHHPLSKLPADGRRKRSGRKRKEARRGSAPSAGATIEEDQEEEEGEEESYSQTDGEEGRTTTPTPDTDTVQFFLCEDDVSPPTSGQVAVATDSNLSSAHNLPEATPTNDPPTVQTNHNGLSPSCRGNSFDPQDDTEAQTLTSVDLDGIK
ncbi:anion exchange protein 2-like, partial [Centroberyx affinis]|uniref:anion exchange protein 2-like n=1 Tax=Centroberyx affinis TaxID=166261 RepID=UPI003A5C0753